MNIWMRHTVLGLAMSLVTTSTAVLAETGGIGLSATSVAGRELALQFSQDSLTTAVKSAVVCMRPEATLTQAKLWMPDMGHGSSPTLLVPQGNGCTLVERLNFLMPGQWELRLAMTDGDVGVFVFDVAQ